MSFEGKNLYGQYIDYSEKKKWPKGFICPYTGTIFYNIRIYYDKEIIIPRKLPPKIIDLTVLLSKPICRLQPWVILKELHLKLSKIMKFLYYFLKLIN